MHRFCFPNIAHREHNVIIRHGGLAHPDSMSTFSAKGSPSDVYAFPETLTNSVRPSLFTWNLVIPCDALAKLARCCRVAASLSLSSDLRATAILYSRLRWWPWSRSLFYFDSDDFLLIRVAPACASSVCSEQLSTAAQVQVPDPNAEVRCGPGRQQKRGLFPPDTHWRLSSNTGLPTSSQIQHQQCSVEELTASTHSLSRSQQSRIRFVTNRFRLPPSDLFAGDVCLTLSSQHIIDTNYDRHVSLLAREGCRSCCDLDVHRRIIVPSHRVFSLGPWSSKCCNFSRQRRLLNFGSGHGVEIQCLWVSHRLRWSPFHEDKSIITNHVSVLWHRLWQSSSDLFWNARRSQNPSSILATKSAPEHNNPSWLCQYPSPSAILLQSGTRSRQQWFSRFRVSQTVLLSVASRAHMDRCPAVDHHQFAEFLLFSGGPVVAATRRFRGQGKDPACLFHRVCTRFVSNLFLLSQPRWELPSLGLGCPLSLTLPLTLPFPLVKTSTSMGTVVSLPVNHCLEAWYTTFHSSRRASYVCSIIVLSLSESYGMCVSTAALIVPWSVSSLHDSYCLTSRSHSSSVYLRSSEKENYSIIMSMIL